MPLHIPFLSRLHIHEYIDLVLTLTLIVFESLIALITRALPSPIINICFRITRRLFNQFSSQSSLRSQEKKKALWSAVAEASDFTELCELWGYYCEEHIVQTGDGYLLGLHRLANRSGDENVKVNAGPGKGGVKKKVVYLHHGLMMNSEVWVCLTERQRCLPFQLVEKGYDVWFGNNRGNKYSKKSVHTPPTSAAFWNFSIDQFAFHDIPDSIDYILQTTHQPSLSYIGFSQGTAQAFATLSIHPTLNEKVNLFIALAPAVSPPGLMSGIVDSFVKASPDILYLAFGRKSILPSTTMWQSILYPPIFVRVIDAALRFLFGWSAVNILPEQKLAAYPHLYSFTSTKSVVHWFQIIRNGVFQMYDDEAPSPLSYRSKYYKVAKFPTKNIKTPIVVIYGGSDSLVNMKVMLKELPRHTITKEVPHYEHLDFLWADSVHELVFPHVFEALEQHAGKETLSLEPLKNGISKIPSPDPQKNGRSKTPERPRRVLPAPSGPDANDGGDESPTTPSTHRAARKASQNMRRAQLIDTKPAEAAKPAEDVSSAQAKSAEISETPLPSTESKSAAEEKPFPAEASTTSPVTQFQTSLPMESPAASNLTALTSNTRPEGWWSSSDEIAGTEPSTPCTPPPHAPSHLRRTIREDSPESLRSIPTPQGARLGRFGNKGITLGVGKAVSGIIGAEGYGQRGELSGGVRVFEGGRARGNSLGGEIDESKKKKRPVPRKTMSCVVESAVPGGRIERPCVRKTMSAVVERPAPASGSPANGAPLSGVVEDKVAEDGEAKKEEVGGGVGT